MPSFTSSQDLRNHVESLPEVLRWFHQTITIPDFRTKDPITLYWRDGLEVVKYLFANPYFRRAWK
jgi:Plavaka transposase